MNIGIKLYNEILANNSPTDNYYNDIMIDHQGDADKVVGYLEELATDEDITTLMDYIYYVEGWERDYND